ncbi:SOS response-associated peptidase family protein [Pseudomonas sp. FW305-70]|uniref:SOS response-associated peptidase family protein n=1 Tax=Pseudomonas sp. FW305-70 TaxID=2751342 RepID=UPI0038F6DED0
MKRGHFAQYQDLADYLAELSAEQYIIRGYDNVPIARYAVAPSTKVCMLHGEVRGIHLGAIRWGWAIHWVKPYLPLAMNSRVEVLASSKYFREKINGVKSINPCS